MVAGHLLLGRRGERLACRYLLKRGFDIVARRYRGRSGELDIIAYDADTLVFIEVKSRVSGEYGDPTEFVGWEKQQRLRRTAVQFIAEYDLGQYAYRFDIVSVLFARTVEISLYRNAF